MNRKRRKGNKIIIIIIQSILITLILCIVVYFYYLAIPEIIVYEEVSSIPLSVDTKKEHIPLIKLSNLPVPNITVDFWKECKELSKDPDSRRFLAINNNSNSQWSPPLLYSFPGSGNTWVRLLIDWSTGVYSGSFYLDKTLLPILPGEVKCDRSVSVIKVHPNIQSFQQLLNGDISEKCKASGYSSYNKVIFLIRNPFDSIWSEFQRKKTGGSHTKGLKRSLGVMEIFRKVSNDLAQKYINMMSIDYYEFSKIAQTMFVKYEDLKNPSTSINELEKIISFIGLTDTASVARLQPGEMLPLPIPTSIRLKCAFALADNPRSHRPKYLDTAMYLTKNDVYNKKSVCRLWAKFGKYASIHGYTIYNNYSCSEST